MTGFIWSKLAKRESETDAQCILWPSLGSDVPSLPLCSAGHTDLPSYSVGGDHRVGIPEGGAEATIQVQWPVWISTSTIGLPCYCLSRGLISRWKATFHNTLWWLMGFVIYKGYKPHKTYVFKKISLISYVFKKISLMKISLDGKPVGTHTASVPQALIQTASWACKPHMGIQSLLSMHCT